MINKADYYKRILNVIEKLTGVWEDGPQGKKTAQKLFDEIYKYSHLAGNCKNNHAKWRQAFLRAAKDLKDF